MTTGNVSDSDMHDMVSAVAGAGISPIVRVRGPTLPVIKRALDTGAQFVSFFKLIFS
jgi:4-hydroxy-2-oxoheptanedioate aldolase